MRLETVTTRATIDGGRRTCYVPAMRKTAMRYYAQNDRETLVADILATAGVFSFSLLAIGLILFRSGLFLIS